MSTHKPYEGYLAEELGNLPLPSEDKAWEQMRRMLEEEEDDRPLIPFFRKGCLPGLLGLLLLLGGLLAYYFYQKNDSGHQHTQNENTQIIAVEQTQSDSVYQNAGAAGPSVAADTISYVGETVKTNDSPTNANNITTAPSPQPAARIAESGQQPSAVKNAFVPNREQGVAAVNPADNLSKTNRHPLRTPGRSNIRVNGALTDGEEPSPTQLPVQTAAPVTDLNNLNADIPPGDQKPTESGGDTLRRVTYADDETEVDQHLKTDTLPTQAASDSMAYAVADSASEPTAKDTRVSENRNRKRPPFTYAAGLGIYQTIPMDGEKAVPYDVFGRKGSLGDYIPVAFFRAQKPKWFIETQFRYGAPNTVKEFVYRSKSDFDSMQLFTTTSYTLRKTFYHQIPLSFHYRIHKNVSIGTGLAYNKFTRAVRLEEVRIGFPGTTIDTLLSSSILNDGNDSAFVNHSFQWLADIRFNWRRFTLGMRYARGLQPYIRYTDPSTGLPAEKRNHSLNAYLLFDIWRSKSK